MKNLTKRIIGIKMIFLLSCMMTLTSHIIIAQVSPQERQALIDFYNATDGDNWTNTTTNNKPWLINDPNSLVSSWFGVTVVDNKVKKISIISNGLEGTIPASFGNLVHLDYVALSVNRLAGPLPNTIGNLVNVETFTVERNAINGLIPTTIGNMSALKILNFGSNQFSGAIPSEIGSLTNLNYLGLYINNLTGEIPSSIGNLSNLERLFLFRNQLVGELPDTLGNLSNLKILDANSNKLSGVIPNEIGSLPNLESLVLSINNFKGVIPQALSNIATSNIFNKLVIGSNNFIFSDFETEFVGYKSDLTTFVYIPQYKVDDTETRVVENGKETILSSTALTSTNNSYQWYKSGVAIADATNKELVISDVSDSDAGVYYFRATNSIITDLTLERNPITLEVIEPLNQECTNIVVCSQDAVFESQYEDFLKTMINTVVSGDPNANSIFRDLATDLDLLGKLRNDFNIPATVSLDVFETGYIQNRGLELIIREGNEFGKRVVIFVDIFNIDGSSNDVGNISEVLCLDISALEFGNESDQIAATDVIFNSDTNVVMTRKMGVKHWYRADIEDDGVYKLDCDFFKEVVTPPTECTNIVVCSQDAVFESQYEDFLKTMINTVVSGDPNANSIFRDLATNLDLLGKLRNDFNIPATVSLDVFETGYIQNRGLELIIREGNEFGKRVVIFVDIFNIDGSSNDVGNISEVLCLDISAIEFGNESDQIAATDVIFNSDTNVVMTRKMGVKHWYKADIEDDGVYKLDCDFFGSEDDNINVQRFCTLNRDITIGDLESPFPGTTVTWHKTELDKALLLSDYVIPESRIYWALSKDNPSLPRIPVSIILDDQIPEGDSTQVFDQTTTLTVADLQVSGTNVQWYLSENGEVVLSSDTLLTNNTYYYAGAGDSACRLRVLVGINNPGGGDCNVLQGLADGSFQDCGLVSGSTTYNNNITCSNWEPIDPLNSPSTWIVNLSDNQPLPGLGVPRMSDKVRQSPDGGIFASALVEYDRGSSLGSNLSTQGFKKTVTNLEIGSSYTISFYQSHGGSSYTGQDGNGLFAKWDVRFGEELKTGKVIGVPLISTITSAPEWEKVEHSFVATQNEQELKFTISQLFSAEVEQSFYFNLLIDGIKVIKADGDCGGINEIGFCLSQMIPTIGDLESPIEGISDVTWFLQEIGGEALSLDRKISNNGTYWAQGNIGEPRVALNIDVYNGITGFDIAGLEYQDFNSISEATIAVLKPLDQNMVWYTDVTGGLPISSDQLLVNGNSYYGQQGTNPCRYRTTVNIGVFEPIGDNVQQFCASNYPTIQNLKETLEIEDEHTLIFYSDETGNLQYNQSDPLVDGQMVYVAQRDSTGESTRKEIYIMVTEIPPPVVYNSNKVFYTDDPVYISDLSALGFEIIWFDEEGTSYSNTDQLVNGETYYAAQSDGTCKISDTECCISIERMAVTVTILEEIPPTILGCERFRPKPGDHYVISGWVRENGVTPVDPREKPFSEVNDVFVNLLNYILENKILTATPKPRDSHIDPVKYVLEKREFDVLIPYIKNNVDKNLTIYNFEYVRERHRENVGPLRTVGFSFALEPSVNAERFVYKTPHISVNGIQYVNPSSSNKIPLIGRYPLMQIIVEGNPISSEMSLKFTNMEFCETGLCLTSSFSITGKSATIYSQDVYDYTNNNIVTPSFGDGLIEKYIVNDYQIDPNYQVQNYENSLMEIRYAMTNDDGEEIPIESSTVEFRPKGAVIDGWQRISADFKIPFDATNMIISLKTNPAEDPDLNINAYFDDIRIHPFEGNMKTFVYDPETQRLQSELDENNYATFYEYDQEGGLIRVKKETERGVYTIQETRSGNSKLNNQD